MKRFSLAISAAVLALAVGAAGALAAGPSERPQAHSAKKLMGHYGGQNQAARSISFDVAGSKARPAIENFAVDVDTECWNDFDHDGASDTLVAHITGFAARLKKDGSFNIYYAPDDDTEFEFDGVVADGRAKVDVIVGGTFSMAGTPDIAGPYQCDSWGDTYAARRAR